VSRIGGARAFALYRIDAAGLKLLELSGAGEGGYSLSMFVAGDANRDGRVDGVDAASLADFDLDGDVDASDRQLLFANLGYAPNLAPVVTTTSFEAGVFRISSTPTITPSGAFR
jgi:hypothetical protein